MAAIVPAWKLAELLEEPERVKPEREAAEDEAAKSPEGAAVMHDTVPTENPEFERFEDLTRKLAQTPKPK
jgi:hypothetical protein